LLEFFLFLTMLAACCREPECIAAAAVDASASPEVVELFVAVFCTVLPVVSATLFFGAAICAQVRVFVDSSTVDFTVEMDVVEVFPWLPPVDEFADLEATDEAEDFEVVNVAEDLELIVETEELEVPVEAEVLEAVSDAILAAFLRARRRIADLDSPSPGSGTGTDFSSRAAKRLPEVKVIRGAMSTNKGLECG
jgi:hypothetical protein